MGDTTRKVALVTEAAQGIGLCHREGPHRPRHPVVAVDVLPTALEAAQTEIGEVATFVADVLSPEAVAS